MIILLHLISLLACLQTAHLYPLRDDSSSLLDNYAMRLAKRPFYPYKDAILSPFGFLDGSSLRAAGQGQRKKAVDSTFIRFGRNSPAESSGRTGRSLDDHPAVSRIFDDSQISQDPSADMSEMLNNKNSQQPQRYLLDHKGCRVTSSQELMKALMNDPNCIRAFSKAKKENVNDTFIRFGKREAPPEKEFESENSNEAR